jgi:hypothetical protein
MDQVYSISNAAFFDELFHYIKEIGAWQLLEDLDPEDREGVLIPFFRFILFTIMRCVGGVKSMLATHEVLLSDVSLMGLLGFNAVQVLEGSNGRGLSQRTKPVEVRGPFSYETAADNIVKIGQDKLAAMLNGTIRCLAAQGMFPKRIDAVLDATDDEATPTYQTDDGRAVPKVTREKRPEVRANRHAKKVKVTVFGWKVWVMWEAQAKMPLAIAIDGINVADNTHAFAVYEQAKANIAGYATIRTLALDRGFLDGKLLTRFDTDKVVIYIPGKANMDITREAREIARRCAQAHEKGRELSGCTYKERTEKVRHGSGKKAWTEEITTTLVGVRELPCDWWVEEGSSSAANSQKFEPRMVNATVVLRWDGAPAGAEKEVVLLTTDPSSDPFVAFDGYDDRSLIENQCNREAKEGWFLEHHPKRSEAGVRVQAYFVFMCMALLAAFRLHRRAAEEAEARGEETGIRRYRRHLEMLNAGKVAVFCGPHFGVMYTHELLVLVGCTVRDRALMGDSAQSILARYRAVAGGDTS